MLFKDYIIFNLSPIITVKKMNKELKIIIPLIIFINTGFINQIYLNSQSVEVQGKLKLDPTYINENDNATYTLVLDTNDAVAFKSINDIGVPSTGIIISEVENNTLLLTAGFIKKGKFVIPFEEPIATNGQNDFIGMDTLNPSISIVRNSVVWTGTEMLVWSNGVGARYNPDTDSWSTISSVGSPSPRSGYTTIWTGTEMIVWGGYDANQVVLNTGAKYNPTTDSWTSISTSNSPSPRYEHSAVWTGSEMIIWGGLLEIPTSQQNFEFTNSGSRYDPLSDTWSATSTLNCPNPTIYHSAIWTGTDMIVHGGINNNNPKKYSPITDTWLTLNSNVIPRGLHIAVWTGSEMIVWGGLSVGNVPTNKGDRYNPTNDTWTTTSLANAPNPRFHHTAVWTGSEMIVWGGINTNEAFFTGGRYSPNTDSWIATSTVNAPVARCLHSAVWTGTEMILYGGTDFTFQSSYNNGGRYRPLSSSYKPPKNTNMYLYSKN